MIYSKSPCHVIYTLPIIDENIQLLKVPLPNPLKVLLSKPLKASLSK